MDGAPGSRRRTSSTRAACASPTSTARGPSTSSTWRRRAFASTSTRPATPGAPRRRSCRSRRRRLSSVQAVDLLGNGTACLVWTSPLPGDASHVDALRRPDGRSEAVPADLQPQQPRRRDARPLRAVDDVLPGGPRGRPPVGHAPPLPRPCRRARRDAGTGSAATGSSPATAYHHGYYDGVEREFRGFGMVEQHDTEELGVLESTGGFPASTNIDAASYVPPVLTKTWFHTGAYPHGRARLARSTRGNITASRNLSDEQLEAMQLPGHGAAGGPGQRRDPRGDPVAQGRGPADRRSTRSTAPRQPSGPTACPSGTTR